MPKLNLQLHKRSPVPHSHRLFFYIDEQDVKCDPRRDHSQLSQRTNLKPATLIYCIIAPRLRILSKAP